MDTQSVSEDHLQQTTQTKPSSEPPAKEARAAQKTPARKASKKSSKSAKGTRTRTIRLYPAASFLESVALGEAIHIYAGGQKVRRLTLLEQMQRSPTSSTTQTLITNSAKYGITKGNFSADFLELTPNGALATDSTTPPREKRQAQFQLAIEGIKPFQYLFNEQRGKKLPAHSILEDILKDGGFELEKPQECVDYFIVNTKDLGLLRTIGGAEVIVPIEQVLDTLGSAQAESPTIDASKSETDRRDTPAVTNVQASARIDWAKTCFIITPIGDEGSETRMHADLFLSALIEPALRESGLTPIRADKIGSAGMITAQILEYVIRSRLAIADLSFHNPNAFYEMAIRHACGRPIIQISRRADRLPFDVNQIRTVVIDTTDIYSLVPRMETYRSEIATQVRAALSESSESSNPISVFFPGFSVNIPKEN